jgi:hypothetical protein
VDILTYALLMEDAQTMTTEEQCQVSTEVMNCALAAIVSIGEPPARPFTIPGSAASRAIPSGIVRSLSRLCESVGCREEGRCRDTFTGARVTIRGPVFRCRRCRIHQVFTASKGTVTGTQTLHPTLHLEVTLSGTNIDAGLATSTVYDRRAVSPGTAADITLQRPTDQDTRSEEIISG